ncbi:hypothetical protein PsorP6_000841 [Peronosclerospora sorghi]|uniref:Uncharacterized protein n=1 Tax=Peronosclerospora sorghi TaxID=230839 RepID=A0ACC0WRR2_9STRA|nr:hypothetical protein PsorP6_000841 [Peronosclerospora sorghi]
MRRPSLSTESGYSMSTTGDGSPSDAVYDAATECYVCDKKFHAFRRKHRCRSCGKAVCGGCARTHKVLPSSSLVRSPNEPVRVCDGCIRDENLMMLERRRAEDIERARARQVAAMQEEERQRELERHQREREIAEALARREKRLRTIEERHLGPRPDLRTLRSRYSRSLDDCARDARPQSLYTKELSSFLEDAEKRSVALIAKPCCSQDMFEDKEDVVVTESVETTMVQEADECAICLETMDVGHAIYTTACGHSFHWSCLKEIQKSDSSNYDKCPSCRATMTEMQVKKQCDHPRVRLGHRYCRDCGAAITESDAKPRMGDPAAGDGAAGSGMHRMLARSGAVNGNQPMSFRGSPHGALVRCPQCQIQMRVLPHMYNILCVWALPLSALKKFGVFSIHSRRVACPSGHMFLVQVATSSAHGRYDSRGGPTGPRVASRDIAIGYPASYYRPTYSEL